MDIRSPNFSVKTTIFLTLIDIASKKVSPKYSTDKIIEPVQLRNSVTSLLACANRYNNINSSTKQTPKKESQRLILGSLICRVLDVFKTLDASQIVLAKGPSTPCTKADIMFPKTATRDMKASKACHDSFDFLLMLCGRPSSRSESISKRGKKNSKLIKVRSGRGSSKNRDSGEPPAPVSPLGFGGDGSNSASFGSPFASPRSPVSLPNDFDYFGGASISTATIPLHPEKNKSIVIETRMGRNIKPGRNDSSSFSSSSPTFDKLERKIQVLEKKIQDKDELNNRLMMQTKLIEESPESASLILDARRLMMVESRNFQLEKQRDVLLASLEGQQQVIDHTERILLGKLCC
jgi:hypothetical protein